MPGEHAEVSRGVYLNLKNRYHGRVCDQPRRGRKFDRVEFANLLFNLACVNVYWWEFRAQSTDMSHEPDLSLLAVKPVYRC